MKSDMIQVIVMLIWNNRLLLNLLLQKVRGSFKCKKKSTVDVFLMFKMILSFVSVGNAWFSLYDP